MRHRPRAARFHQSTQRMFAHPCELRCGLFRGFLPVCEAPYHSTGIVFCDVIQMVSNRYCHKTRLIIVQCIKDRQRVLHAETNVLAPRQFGPRAFGCEPADVVTFVQRLCFCTGQRCRRVVV